MMTIFKIRLDCPRYYGGLNLDLKMRVLFDACVCDYVAVGRVAVGLYASGSTWLWVCACELLVGSAVAAVVAAA